MTKNHFTYEILNNLIGTTSISEIFGWSEINKKSQKKLKRNLKKFIKYSIKSEEKAAIRGFKIGFDLVLIQYGFSPKYYSIWPKED